MKYLVIIIVLFLSGCCALHSEVRYKYDNITIVRIDECGISKFYYERNGIREEGEIWAKYSGINAGFYAYLLFSPSGKCSIKVAEGAFYAEDIDTTIFNFDYGIDTFLLHPGSLRESDSVCYIAYPIEYELNRSNKDSTNVEKEYKIDDNEFWWW